LVHAHTAHSHSPSHFPCHVTLSHCRSFVSSRHPPLSLFFFFTILPPPSSTLFPYTTLFRSPLCLCHQGLRHSTPDHLVPFPAQQALLFGDDHHLTELARTANAGAFPHSRTCRLSSTFHIVLPALPFCSTN